jgi:hypothetical protein
MVVTAARMCATSIVIGVEHVTTKTPEALANFSPGLERSDNPGFASYTFRINPERVSDAYA